MADATIKQSGGDFATIAAFLASGATSGGDTGTISGTWSVDDSAAVTWNKAVTIVATGSSVQAGRPWRTGDTTYRHKVTSGHAFTVTADVDITGINIQSDSSGVSDELFRAAGSAGGVLTNCQLGFTGNTDQQDVWYTEDCTTKAITFEQCFFYDVGRSIVDAVSGGQSGILTINFNSCAALNIGANGGRAGGGWVGCGNTNAGDTTNANAHNCLLNNSAIYVFGLSANSISNVVATNSITNVAIASLSNDEDSETTTGTLETYTWTEAADPGTGDFVGMLDITAGDYDPTLTDHANNDAIAVHAVVTAAGLTIPTLDIKGQTRDKATPSFDVGPYAVTLDAGGGTTIPIFHRHYELNKR